MGEVDIRVQSAPIYECESLRPGYGSLEWGQAVARVSLARDSRQTAAEFLLLRSHGFWKYLYLNREDVRVATEWLPRCCRPGS